VGKKERGGEGKGTSGKGRHTRLNLSELGSARKKNVGYYQQKFNAGGRRTVKTKNPCPKSGRDLGKWRQGEPKLPTAAFKKAPLIEGRKSSNPPIGRHV